MMRVLEEYIDLGHSDYKISLDPSASLMYRGLKALCRNSRHPVTHGIRVSSGLLDVLMTLSETDIKVSEDDSLLMPC